MKTSIVRFFFAWALALMAFFASSQVNAQVGPKELTEFYIEHGVIPTQSASFARLLAKNIPVVRPATNFSVLVEISEASPNPVVGLVVSDKGNMNSAYLVRAIGPGLKRLGGVEGVAHPSFELSRSGVSAGRGWEKSHFELFSPSAASEIRKAESLSGASPLDNGDVTTLLNLQPGSYTISVRSEQMGKVEPGYVLLEVYQIPSMAIPNRSPSVPQISGKPYAEAGVPYTLQMVSTDREAGDIEYHLDWDEDGRVDEIVTARSGFTAEVTHTWATHGKKYFRLVAFDGELYSSQTLRVEIEVRLRDK